MKRFTQLSLFLIISLFFLSESYANVFVDDADSNAVIDEIVAFTSATIPTGSGMAGDYELIACGVFPFSQDQATFLAPSPGDWTELDNGPCGGVNQCIGAIWGRFTNIESSQDISCNWSDPTFVFAAGSFRYNDVDPVDPIIAVACNIGVDDNTNIIATAPSINTVAGSQVARIYTYRDFETGFSASHTNSNTDLTGTFTSDAVVSSINIHMQGDTEFFDSDGPTGEASMFIGDVAASWRACTIALRMAPERRNIPTMSEWGFLAVAVFMGSAGVWYLRRRQAA